MKGITYTFFVTETEYSRLQAACPEDFPFDYAQFSAGVDQTIKEAAPIVAIEKVFVSIEQFLAWCAESGVQPGNLNRARYAALIGHPRGRLNEDL